MYARIANNGPSETEKKACQNPTLPEKKYLIFYGALYGTLSMHLDK